VTLSPKAGRPEHAAVNAIVQASVQEQDLYLDRSRSRSPSSASTLSSLTDLTDSEEEPSEPGLAKALPVGVLPFPDPSNIQSDLWASREVGHEDEGDKGGDRA
jgi:hypothetical protein